MENDFNFNSVPFDDNPATNSICQSCPNHDNCPWISVIDCIEAGTSFWFNDFYYDNIMGRVID